MPRSRRVSGLAHLEALRSRFFSMLTDDLHCQSRFRSIRFAKLLVMSQKKHDRFTLLQSGTTSVPACKLVTMQEEANRESSNEERQVTAQRA
jgi:hypothetical protein